MKRYSDNPRMKECTQEDLGRFIESEGEMRLKRYDKVISYSLCSILRLLSVVLKDNRPNMDLFDGLTVGYRPKSKVDKAIMIGVCSLPDNIGKEYKIEATIAKSLVTLPHCCQLNIL